MRAHSERPTPSRPGTLGEQLRLRRRYNNPSVFGDGPDQHRNLVPGFSARSLPRSEDRSLGESRSQPLLGSRDRLSSQMVPETLAGFQSLSAGFHRVDPRNPDKCWTAAPIPSYESEFRYANSQPCLPESKYLDPRFKVPRDRYLGSRSQSMSRYESSTEPVDAGDDSDDSFYDSGEEHYSDKTHGFRGPQKRFVLLGMENISQIPGKRRLVRNLSCETLPFQQPHSSLDVDGSLQSQSSSDVGYYTQSQPQPLSRDGSQYPVDENEYISPFQRSQTSEETIFAGSQSLRNFDTLVQEESQSLLQNDFDMESQGDLDARIRSSSLSDFCREPEDGRRLNPPAPLDQGAYHHNKPDRNIAIEGICSRSRRTDRKNREGPDKASGSLQERFDHIVNQTRGYSSRSQNMVSKERGSEDGFSERNLSQDIISKERRKKEQRSSTVHNELKESIMEQHSNLISSEVLKDERSTNRTRKGVKITDIEALLKPVHIDATDLFATFGSVRTKIQSLPDIVATMTNKEVQGEQEKIR